MDIKKSALIIACFSFFLMGNLWTLLPSIGNVLLSSSQYSLTNLQYGVLVFVLIASSIIYAVFAGIVGQQKGMRRVLLECLCFFVIAALLYSLANFSGHAIFWVLFCAQVFLGFAISGMIASFSSYLPLLIPNKTPILLTGIYSFTNLGSLSCPLIFHLVLKDGDWWMLSSGILFLGLGLLIFGNLLLPDIRNPYIHAAETLGEFSRKIPLRFFIFFILIAFFSVIENTVDAWSVIVLHEVKKSSIGEANMGLSIFWGVVGVGQLTVCLLLHWIRPSLIYKALPVFMVLGYYGLYLSRGSIQEYLSFISLGIACSAFFALSMSFVEKDFKKCAELTSGLAVMSYFVGSAAGSAIFWISLQFSEANLAATYLVTGLLAVAILFIVPVAVKRVHSSN